MLVMAWALVQATYTFTLAEARATPSQELADMLLGPGHPPIEKVIVHPVGMEAPSASLQGVTLIGVPDVAGGDHGWCRRNDQRVTLVPTAAGVNAAVTATPTRVERVETQSYYRIADADCGAKDARFFFVDPAKKQAQFALMQRLLAARTLAQGTQDLPFELHCSDDSMQAPNSGGDRCREGDGRALLAALPLERTHNLSVGGDATRYSFNRQKNTWTKRTYPVHHDAAIGMSDDRMVVDATIAEHDGRIMSITIKRHIPYPG